MYLFLIILVIGLFVAMLFLNLYFRIRVLRVYRILVQSKVEFGARHIFNQSKLEQEIFPRYPKHQADIQTFVDHLRYSVKMATVLLFLITVFGAILMYYR